MVRRDNANRTTRAQELGLIDLCIVPVLVRQGSDDTVMVYGPLVSAAALALASQSPFESFDKLERAAGEYFSEHFLEMPAHYTQDEFMEFLFEEKIVLGVGEKGWKINPAIVVSVRLDTVTQAQDVEEITI